jgi:hypothetical protein
MQVVNNKERITTSTQKEDAIKIRVLRRSKIQEYRQEINII